MREKERRKEGGGAYNPARIGLYHPNLRKKFINPNPNLNQLAST